LGLLFYLGEGDSLVKRLRMPVRKRRPLWAWLRLYLTLKRYLFKKDMNAFFIISPCETLKDTFVDN